MNQQPIPHLGDPLIIALLEKILMEAKAGQIVSVAILTVSPSRSLNWPAQGIHVPDLYLAASLLQRHIENTVTKKSIIR